MTMLWIMYDDDVVGVVAPVRLEEQLSHVSFKVYGEEDNKSEK